MAEVQFEKAKGFDKSFLVHTKRDPSIKKRFKIFVAAKSQRPPAELPPGFKEHRLHGKLSRFNEIHLGKDSLLIFTDQGGVVTLYRVLSHDDIRTGRGI